MDVVITPEDQARIAARYPRSSVTTRVAIGCGVLATVLGMVWLAWAGLFHANPAIAARVSAFTITSDNVAEAVVTVQRNSADVTGRCTIIAQAVSFERVGELTLDIKAGEPTLRDHPVSIKTLKRATSVSVEGCTPG